MSKSTDKAAWLSYVTFNLSSRNSRWAPSGVMVAFSAAKPMIPLLRRAVDKAAWGFLRSRVDEISSAGSIILPSGGSGSTCA